MKRYTLIPNPETNRMDWYEAPSWRDRLLQLAVLVFVLVMAFAVLWLMGQQ